MREREASLVSNYVQQLLIEIAAVFDGNVGEANGMSGLLQAEQKLFVNAIIPADVGLIAKEPYLADERSRAVGGDGTLLHDVDRVVLPQASKQVVELGAIGLIEPFVGVEPEQPCSGSVAGGFIACGGEGVVPGHGDDVGCVLAGEIGRAIVGAGVHDDDLVDEVSHRVPTRGQVATFPIDHIKPRSVGGETAMPNLALACPHCNAHKWAHGTVSDPLSGISVPLFHPRRDNWPDHFQWSVTESGVLEGKTASDRATLVQLQINTADMVAIRQRLPFGKYKGGVHLLLG